MAVQFKDGAVLCDTGSVAMDAACCCGECTEVPPLAHCESTKADFGAVVDIVRVDLEITGTHNCVSTVPFYLCPDLEYDWEGTWSVSCDDTDGDNNAIWYKYTYLCANATTDFYAYERLTLRAYTSTGVFYFRVTWSSGYYSTPKATPTVPTDDSPPPTGSGNTSLLCQERYWEWRLDTDQFEFDLYTDPTACPGTGMRRGTTFDYLGTTSVFSGNCTGVSVVCDYSTLTLTPTLVTT